MTTLKQRFASPMLGVLALLALAAPALGAAPDPAELAARIDGHIAAAWQAEEIEPAPASDDAMFVRRVYLDLVGRIPTVAEVREFLGDSSSDKRAKLAARLLDTGAHHRHMASFWRREWIPQTDTPQFSALVDEIDLWLAGKLQDGVSYDRIVLDILTATRNSAKDGKPTGFLAASEFKAENLAANTTRAFLGINLDCAQCHDHPFARWTRNQFWETAAFFAKPICEAEGVTRLELPIPETTQTATPRFLTDPQPTWPETLHEETGRVVLAGWVTDAGNPYFARNAVNRMWANVFGAGLIEPLDDMSGDNPASHPELLDALAQAFIDSGFDVDYITASLVLTKAYQLSANTRTEEDVEPRLFARATVRGLTGEQLHDSLRVSAGLPVERDDLDPTNAFRERKQFAHKFRIARAGSAERSILQALSLMNGQQMPELTDPAKTPTLRVVADAPFLDARGKIEALYLASLGRKPTSDELNPLVAYVQKGGADGDAKRALADIFWALLNSSEFSTNH